MTVEPSGQGTFPYTLHGGTGPVEAQWYFREESLLPVAVQRWTFPVGVTEGVHAHADRPGEALDEIYVGMRGRVRLSLGPRVVELGPGDAVLAPPGLEHGVENPGPEEAEVLVVWGPATGGMDWTRSGMGRAAHEAAPPAG